MIVHTDHIPITNPAKLLDQLRSITVQPWHAHARGYTVSYELRDWPDYQLMEGRIVPPHNDGIAGYRPLLILANSGYIFRGRTRTKAQAFGVQKPGDVMVLDIETQHEVWPNPLSDKNSWSAWSALVWGPGGMPCLKTAWSVEMVGEYAEEMFVEFLGAMNDD